MQFRRRITLQLVLQLVLVGLVCLLLIVLTFQFLTRKSIEMSLNRDFSQVGLALLVETSTLKDGRIEFDPELLSMVDHAGGWLQTLNEDGEVTFSYRTPDDVPTQYAPGELTAYWSGDLEFPYALYIWIEEKNGITYTLLFGQQFAEDRIMQQLTQSTSRNVYQDQTGTLLLPESIKAVVQQHAAWIQLIDHHGQELAAYNKPKQAPDQYTVQDLVLRTRYSNSYSSRVSVHFEPETGRTWLVHMPYASTTPDGKPILTEAALLLGGFAILSAIILCILGLMALWYGRRFGTPILHVMDWLQLLAEGSYREPADRKGQPRSRNRTGKLKRRYRLYEDVLTALHNLTITLQQNENMRNELDQKREEWIAGISHDLKTPISSIMGYAHLLSAEQYEWTQAEVKQFAKVMKQKTNYLDQLINDLNMTFRLKSDEQTLDIERTEMNDFLSSVMIQFLNDPFFEQSDIVFNSTEKPLFLQIDRHSFRRIVHNLLANAVLHNPEGTKVEVTLHDEHEKISIEFRDNGSGMDDETIRRLFDRYYRGTNTEGSSHGTGLGMAIAKQLVLLHGGEVEVESAEGNGSLIRLVFQRHQGDAVLS